MKSGAEVKVGIVVALALVVLGLIIYFLIGSFLSRVGYPVDVIFERADVRSGDTVAMSGVPIGHVQSVRLTKENRALVRLRIDHNVAIHEKYTVNIVAGSLLGQSFVEVRPVPDAEAGPVLPPRAIMHGEPYVRLEDVISRAKGLVGTLDEVAKSVAGMLKNKQLATAMQNSVTHLSQAAADTEGLARELRGMATESRPQISRVLANIQAVSQDLRQTSDLLAKQAQESSIPENLEETAARLRSAVEQVDEIVAQVGEMVTSAEMQDLMASVTSDLQAATQSMRQASDEIRSAAGKADSAMTSIEEASKDAPAITGNVREASRNLRDASADIKEMSHDARGKLGEVTGGAAKAAKVMSELPNITTGVDVGAQYLTRNGRWWIDANADIRTTDRLVRLGVADLGETNRFNLQLGQPLGPGRIRYGVIQSQAGLGYDWPVTRGLTLSGEAFNPNDLQANVFGYWGLPGMLSDWDVVFGYRGAGGDGSPVLGVRAEK